MTEKSKYQFLLIPPFRLPTETQWGYQTLHLDGGLPKTERLMNAEMTLPYLEGIDWDLHPGAEATYGDWPVETREEFTYAANARLKNIREACESGKYNGVILLGGGEPGFPEAREMCRASGIVCTANGHSQMYLATMLGHKFSVIDIAGVHNVYYRDLIYTHQLQDRCASIRNIGMRLPRPGVDAGPQLKIEREKALGGQALGRGGQRHRAGRVGATWRTAPRSSRWGVPVCSGSSRSSRPALRNAAGRCRCSRATRRRFCWRNSWSILASTHRESPTWPITPTGCPARS